MTEQDDDGRDYVVVVNDEEQYSIWWADRPLPSGWRAEGKNGRRADCLAHIERIWTDMRPLSLRRRMAEETPG
jgi:MbtH protein